MSRPRKNGALPAAAKADRAPAPAAMDAKGLKARARELSEQAMATLAAIMTGQGTDSAKLAAAREVLDRAHGKVKAPAKSRTRGRKAVDGDGGLTVIVKRFSDITPEEEAAADATERGEW